MILTRIISNAIENNLGLSIYYLMYTCYLCLIKVIIFKSNCNYRLFRLPNELI